MTGNSFDDERRRGWVQYLRNVPYKARQIAEEYQATVKQVNERWDLDAASKAKGRALAKEEAAKRLAQLRSEAEATAQALTKELEGLAHKPVTLSAGDALHAEGLRARLRKSDDPASEAMRLAREAASNNDDSRLRALRAIVPDLLAEMGQPEDAGAELDLFLRATTLGVDGKDAMVKLPQVGRGVYRVGLTLNYIDYDLREGNFDDPKYHTPLPGWDDEDMLEVGGVEK